MTDFVDRTLVAPIRLDDVAGAWEFHPQTDISTYELALIVALFNKMLAQKTRLDWREYLLREHSYNTINGVKIVRLARHFQDV